MKLNRFAQLALISLTIVCSATPAKSQVGALAFGVVLDNLLQKLGALMTAAQNAGSILEVGAGGQVAQAIEYAKHAYEDELGKTVDQLGDAQKKLIDDLTTQVNAIEKHSVEDLRLIVDRGAIALNTLPFNHTLPQAAGYSPYYVVPSIANATLLSVRCNFFDSAKQGYEPSLRVGGKDLPPVEKTTLNLTFAVPSASVQVPGTGTSYIPVTLSVPYSKTCFGVFHCDDKATFTFLLVSVPPKPGKLTFIVTSMVPGVQRDQKTGVLHSQHSDQDDIPQPTANGFQWCDQPDPGWRVVTNSVQPIYAHTEGHWRSNGNTSNLANACWNMTTVHHGIGTSGKIDFRLSFLQERDMQQAVNKPSDVALDWGSTRLFEIPPTSTWRAVFEQFDGKKIDINSANFRNPYLSVETSNLTILFSTIP
jgi:hypothetical protein